MRSSAPVPGLGLAIEDRLCRWGHSHRLAQTRSQRMSHRVPDPRVSTDRSWRKLEELARRKQAPIRSQELTGSRLNGTCGRRRRKFSLGGQIQRWTNARPVNRPEDRRRHARPFVLCSCRQREDSHHDKGRTQQKELKKKKTSPGGLTTGTHIEARGQSAEGAATPGEESPFFPGPRGATANPCAAGFLPPLAGLGNLDPCRPGVAAPTAL